jgi:hypothetical protein
VTEPTEVTLSWYDYTVLLGYAWHHAEDQEMRDSINRIMERTRKRVDAELPENRTAATSGPCLECGVAPGGLHGVGCSKNRSARGAARGPCTASRKQAFGGGLLCTKQAGHGIIQEQGGRAWQHYDGGRGVWWDQVDADA